MKVKWNRWLSAWCVAVAVLVTVGVSGCATPSLVATKLQVKAYYENGSYERDVVKAFRQAEKFLPVEGAYNAVGSAVVFDIDDTVLNTYEYQHGMGFGHYSPAWHQWIEMRRAKAIGPALAFYNLAKSRGIAVFFVSGRREKFREATVDNLRKAGFDGWADLYLKPTDYKGSTVDLKVKARQAIEAKGYKIVLNIGDQKSDLEGGHAVHTVKLPNYIYGE